MGLRTKSHAAYLRQLGKEKYRRFENGYAVPAQKS